MKLKNTCKSTSRIFITLAALLAPVLSVNAQYTPLTNGLVAWWRAEGDAVDSSGGHDGTLLGAAFEPGRFGQAFSFGPTANRVFVPDSDAFKLTNSLSIGAWVYPRAYSWHVLERSGNVDGSSVYTIGMDAVANFEFHFHASFTDYEQLSAPMSLNQWRYVTATLDGDTGVMRLYIDGVVVAEKTTSLRPFGDIPPDIGPGLGIGNTPDGGGFPFVGLVDEVALSSRALSQEEVRALAVAGPPFLVQQPRPSSQTAVVGGAASIRAEVGGSPPLTLQWYLGESLLPDATNAILTLTNLHTWQSGSYSLALTNQYGWTNSQPALLSVLPAVLGIDMVPRVALEGDLGYTYRVEWINEFGPTNAWQTAAILTISQQPQYYLDFSAIGQPKRFYRMVQVGTK